MIHVRSGTNRLAYQPPLVREDIRHLTTAYGRAERGSFTGTTSVVRWLCESQR